MTDTDSQPRDAATDRPGPAGGTVVPAAIPAAIPATSPAPVARAPSRMLVPLLVLLVIGFLAWGLWRAFQPQPVPLQGQIDAQQVNVSSKVPGRVGQVAVRLGQKVSAGDLVFEIDSPEARAKLAQARAAEAAAGAQATKAEQGARPEEVEMARSNRDRALAAEQIARTTYERLDAMVAQGVMAPQKRDEARAQWQAALGQSKAAEAQYRMVQAGARPEDIAAAQAQARQVAGVVAEAEVAIAETRILAPIAGEVGQIQIQAGEIAPQGFPVVTLVDLADIWAVLAVREDDLAGFAMGSRHRATLPALKQSVEFEVSSVAVMPDFATWRAARPGGTDLRTFEVRLRPVAPVDGLRPGMSVVLDGAR